MVLALKMYDNTVAFVRVTKKMKLDSVKYYEYAPGSKCKLVNAHTHGGVIVQLEVQARIR